MVKQNIVKVRFHLKTSAFHILWLKQVKGFDPAKHCAKCLIGSFVPGIPFKQTKAGFCFEAEVDMEGMRYLYLCGVAGRWADNLHLALEPAEGSSVRYEDERICVEVEGARLLPIDPLPEEVAAPLTAAFHKCRNYRFGWQYLRLVSEEACGVATGANVV